MANYTKEDLIAFEEDIGKCFDAGMIRAPIHLYSNNEEKMIEIFDTHYSTGDWVCTTWRSHYQCLLAGVPRDELKQAILEGKSITLAFKKYNVISSAIVGGILPISTGIALGIKKSGGKNKVLCFLGDMAYETGVAHESIKYATRNELPILFIVEDNGISVCTDTQKTWGKYSYLNKNLIRYEYKSKWPHAGQGKRIQF